MNLRIHVDINVFLIKRIEREHSFYSRIPKINVENDEKKFHLTNTAIISSGKNHQWMLKLVSGSVM